MPWNRTRNVRSRARDYHCNYLANAVHKLGCKQFLVHKGNAKCIGACQGGSANKQQSPMIPMRRMVECGWREREGREDLSPILAKSCVVLVLAHTWNILRYDYINDSLHRQGRCDVQRHDATVRDRAEHKARLKTARRSRLIITVLGFPSHLAHTAHWHTGHMHSVHGHRKVSGNKHNFSALCSSQ